MPFLPIAVQKVAWLGTDGDSEACLTLHHHSLDPYIHIEDMEWFSSSIFSHMPANSITIAQNLQQSANFLPIAAQKVAWLGTYGDSDACLSLHHHSLDDPYRGHGMVQQ
jgi:hypothetical protein